MKTEPWLYVAIISTRGLSCLLFGCCGITQPNLFLKANNKESIFPRLHKLKEFVMTKKVNFILVQNLVFLQKGNSIDLTLKNG